MSRTGDLYMMSRLSYEQAIDDYENKKSNSLLVTYECVSKKLVAKLRILRKYLVTIEHFNVDIKYAFSFTLAQSNIPFKKFSTIPIP